MANETRVTGTLTIAKGYLKYNGPQRSFATTMAGTHADGGVVNIGITEEALVIDAGVATLGLAEFTNCDTVNQIAIGVKPASTFYPLIYLLPGESYIMRLYPSAAPYAIAYGSGGAVLDWKIWEA